jgi:hypothetical protein
MVPIDDTHLPQNAALAEALRVQEALLAENAALRSQVTLLLGRVAELERRLGLNSSNSSKLPGSDDRGPLLSLRLDHIPGQLRFLLDVSSIQGVENDRCIFKLDYYEGVAQTAIRLVAGFLKQE